MRKLTKQDIRNSLAMLWAVCSFIFLFKLLAKEIPAANKDTVNTVCGVVLGQLVTILAFYFGQSKSEVDTQKAETRAKLDAAATTE